MKSKTLRRTVIPNDPTTKEIVTINMDDPHLVSQLLRLLEGQLDKHIDDCKYVSSITAKHDGQRAN